jgi:hypothetical protein
VYQGRISLGESVRGTKYYILRFYLRSLVSIAVIEQYGRTLVPWALSVHRQFKDLWFKAILFSVFALMLHLPVWWPLWVFLVTGDKHWKLHSSTKRALSAGKRALTAVRGGLPPPVPPPPRIRPCIQVLFSYVTYQTQTILWLTTKDTRGYHQFIFYNGGGQEHWNIIGNRNYKWSPRYHHCLQSKQASWPVLQSYYIIISPS